MRMSTQIPAMVQTPNLAETVMRGRQMQMLQQEFQNRNALAGYLKDNGAGIMSGDPNALAGLAQYDPNMALGIQNQNRADARAERSYGLQEKQVNAGMANDSARLEIARQQAAQSAAEHGARMSAFEREAEAVAVKRSGDMAAAAYALGPEGWAEFQGSDNGVEFAQFGYDTAPIAIAGARGTLEGLGLGDGEQFTLGNNQARYDAQGNLIARGPEKPADQPSSVQEYLFAQEQGEQRPYTQWLMETKKAGANSVTVSSGTEIGTVPPGWEVYLDPATNARAMRPIAGGPAATEAALLEGKNDRAAGKRDTVTDVIVGAAKNARDAMASAALPTTGPAGQAVSLLSNTNAAEVRRQVEVLKSNATIENLQAMRNASPTGAALGSVTQQENQMLAAATGALDAAASGPHFERALDDYERVLLRIIHGDEAGERTFAETRPGAAPAPGAATTAPPASPDDDLFQKYGIQP